MKIMPYAHFLLHGNLKYSSIPEKYQTVVIENCYWPIISLLKKFPKFRIAVEFPGETLEIIQNLDPAFLEYLKEGESKRRLEFVSSSYSQTIMPLIPYTVNLENLELGQKIYGKILGKMPSIAFVNEQCFSQSLVDLYKKTGFSAFILDWDNIATSLTSKFRFLCPQAVGVSNVRLPVIWNSSISFQKFQKYIYEELDLEEYLNFLKRVFNSLNSGYLTLYANDWETLFFDPKNLTTLSRKNTAKRIVRMENLLKIIFENNLVDFALPSEILKKFKSQTVISLTTSSAPIITKKQDKYNATRWAVCGRNNAYKNTLCWRLLKKRILNKAAVSLFGSDYRTFTVPQKEKKFYYHTGKLLQKKTLPAFPENHGQISPTLRPQLTLETNWVKAIFNLKRGGTISSLVFKKISPLSLCGTLPFGFFDTISLSPDWYSGHTIIHTAKEKITDLIPVEKVNFEETKMFQEVYFWINLSPVLLVKKISLSKIESVFLAEYFFSFSKPLYPLSFRTGIITLNPAGFNLNSLKFSTHNGGRNLETFKLKGENINHDEPLALNLSARNCLGATEGKVVFFDKDKALQIETDKSKFYTVFLLHHEESEDSFLTRLLPTIAELDETSKTRFDQPLTLSFKITAKTFKVQKELKITT